jgi:hypothetical protein
VTLSWIVPFVLLPACADAGGAAAGDTAGVANEAPHLTLEDPADGETVGEGEAIAIDGLAADDADDPAALVVSVTAGDAEVTTASPADDGTFSATVTLDPGEWTLGVTVADSDGASSTVAKAVTVLDAPTNHAPSAPAFHVDPAAPVAGEALSVVIDTASVDPDGDPVVTAIFWSAEGHDPVNDTVPAGVTVAGETWTAMAIASDGTLVSSPVTASVTIADAAALRGSADARR